MTNHHWTFRRSKVVILRCDVQIGAEKKSGLESAVFSYPVGRLLLFGVGNINKPRISGTSVTQLCPRGPPPSLNVYQSVGRSIGCLFLSPGFLWNFLYEFEF